MDAYCVWQEGERLNEAPVGAILVIALPCSSASVRGVLGEEGVDFFLIARLQHRFKFRKLFFAQFFAHLLIHTCM